jgi:hypothetical protein
VKKLRFGDLVRVSGRPRTLTLWTAPKKSAELQKAMKTNRILTVQQPNAGTKRDVGIVGFRPERQASFFLFPRPLKAEPGQEVIGINYSLLEEPPAPDPVAHRKRSRAPSEPARTSRIPP